MLLYSLLYSLLLPIFIIRTIIKDKNSLSQKLGFGYKKHNSPIHIHCVSVGEFNASIPLIDKLLINHEIVITTTTKTGALICKNYYNDKITHYYFPFDLKFICKKFIKNINPKISIILETEIWPNFISTNYKYKIKTILINARLSDKSYFSYKKLKNFSINIINKFTLIATQDELSDNNFKKLGAKNTQILGNLKFDITPTINKEKLLTIKNIVAKRAIIVCASTHKNEEELIIQSYKKNPCKQLLVIIPRHPQHFIEVEKILLKENIIYIKQSNNNHCNKNTQILLADSMGFVLEFYSLCDLAFIGGSLVPAGGHNMLESIAFNKLTIFGNYTFNFKNLVQNLLQTKSVIKIQNSDDIFNIIKDLKVNKYIDLKVNAQKFLQKNTGTSKKLVSIINSLVS